MKKETKQAFKALLEATKQALNNTETPEIERLMPEYGKHLWTDEKDDNGNICVHYFDRSEDEAIYEAQYNLLNGDDDNSLDEFFCESSLRPLMVEFMRCVAKEAMKC